MCQPTSFVSTGFAATWQKTCVAGFLLTSVVLSGCASIGLSGPPSDLFTLSPKSTFSSELPFVDWQLVIEEPLASGGLDSSRIALKPEPTEFNYFAGARWTERAPVLVQTLIIESFETSGKIVGVGRQSIGLRSDYNLKLELREFQAEYFDKSAPPAVRVRVNAKLVRQPRQQIIASKSFEFRRVAEEDSVRSIVRTFDSALGRAMKELVEWTLTVGQKDVDGS